MKHPRPDLLIEQGAPIVLNQDAISLGKIFSFRWQVNVLYCSSVVNFMKFSFCIFTNCIVLSV